MEIDLSEDKEVTTKKDAKELKRKMEIDRERDHQKVKGIFHFYEVPGGTLSFMYCFYPGDPIESFDLKDGEIYEIPFGVAKHLNNNCWYPVHSYMQDETGKSSVKVGQKVKRCGFQALTFTDKDTIGNYQEEKILSVEKV